MTLHMSFDQKLSTTAISLLVSFIAPKKNIKLVYMHMDRLD